MSDSWIIQYTETFQIGFSQKCTSSMSFHGFLVLNNPLSGGTTLYQLTYGRISWVLPSSGHYEYSHYQHPWEGLCGDVSVQLKVNVECRCWTIWQEYVPFYKCLPHRHYHDAVHQRRVRVPGAAHPPDICRCQDLGRCAVGSRCCTLHHPDDTWRQVSFHLLLCHRSISFGEVSVQVFGPFLTCFLIVECEEFLAYFG